MIKGEWLIQPVSMVTIAVNFAAALDLWAQRASCGLESSHAQR
jgi:hypothetical protein